MGVLFQTRENRTIQWNFDRLKVLVSGRILPGTLRSHFIMHVPVKPFCESLEFGHFSDLHIPMFLRIELNRGMNPKFVYLVIVLLMLRDYHHFQSILNFVRWSTIALRNTYFARLSGPPKRRN